VEVVASLSQGRTAAAQCGLFTHKSVPVIFEPPCTSGIKKYTHVITKMEHSKISLFICTIKDNSTSVTHLYNNKVINSAKLVKIGVVFIRVCRVCNITN